MNENAALWLIVAIIVVALVFVLFAFAIGFLIVRPWLRAVLSGAPVSVVGVVGMRLRGSPPMLLVDAYIALRQAGVKTNIAGVESVYIVNRTRVRSRDDLVELVKAGQASGEKSPRA